MQNETKSWLILLVLACVWGSSFILMKLGMEDLGSGAKIFNSNQVGSLRMAFAGLVLLPFGLKHLRKLKGAKTIFSILIVGFFGNFFPAFLFTYAETGLSSGYTGMLNSCVPIFTILISFAVFGQAIKKIQIIGIVIGTAGVIWLMIAGAKLDSIGTWWHIGAVVLATLCYAISVNVIKNNLQGMKPFVVTCLAFLTTIIPAIGLVFFFETPEVLVENEYGLQGILFILVLAVVGTAIAVIIFNYLISISSALFASSVTYFIPIVAVIIGLYFKETINLWQILAMFVILVGVYIANSKQRNKLKKEN